MNNPSYVIPSDWRGIPSDASRRTEVISNISQRLIVLWTDLRYPSHSFRMTKKRKGRADMPSWIWPIILTLAGLLAAQLLYRFLRKKRIPLFLTTEAVWMTRAVCGILGIWIATPHFFGDHVSTVIRLAWALPILVPVTCMMIVAHLTVWKDCEILRHRRQQPPPPPPTGGMNEG